MAWKAVLRNKPAISFGNAWYMGCKSIFCCNNISDVELSINKIVNGYLHDQEDHERYAATIEKS